MSEQEFTFKEWKDQMGAVVALPDEDDCDDCKEMSLCENLQLRVDILEDQVSQLQEIQQIIAKQILRRM